MVMDAGGPDLDYDTIEESPNPIAKKLYEMLQAADQALWPRCEKHSQLSAVARLLNIKSEYHLPEICHDSSLEFMKEALPQRNTLPEKFYDTKKMVEGLGLPVEKIDCCECGCMIYWGVDSALKCCKLCGHPRYKSRRRSQQNIRVMFRIRGCITFLSFLGYRDCMLQKQLLRICIGMMIMTRKTVLCIIHLTRRLGFILTRCILHFPRRVEMSGWDYAQMDSNRLVNRVSNIRVGQSL